MSEQSKTPPRKDHPYYCATHGWWSAVKESGCPECVRWQRSRIRQLEAELAALTAQDNAKARLQAICEIYNGMEGFEPKTAPEDYLLRIVRQMYHAAIHGKEKSDGL